MKHIIIPESRWEYSSNPFPAYRANLVYGRNQRDYAFLPLKVDPLVQYTVTGSFREETPNGGFLPFVGHTFYEGTDAEEAKRIYAEKQAYALSPEGGSGRCWAIKIDHTAPLLPEGQFDIIKTREKGTTLVVPGKDDTNRCLLFVGCEGGFRGGVSVIKAGTILKRCSASNACNSFTAVIVLLKPGQSIAFHTYGRRTDEVYQYTWIEGLIKNEHFPKSEWDAIEESKMS